MLRLFAVCMLFFSLFALISCGEGPTKTVDDTTAITDYQEPESKEDLINLQGELISIPSPIQMSIFIQKNSSGFKEELLLDAKHLDPYQTTSQKAIALGIYGAELGYVSLYKEDDKTLGYMNAARNLAEDIGLSNAFNESLVERFSNNLGEPDSMVVMVSEIYEAADSYLKTNERTDIAALVLLGGWIEGLHVLCEEAKTGNEAIRVRLAEQKSGFDRLHELVQKYSDNTAVEEMSPLLSNLQAAFNQVSAKYAYQRPEVRLAEQRTILKGSVKHTMDEAAMTAIDQASTALRNHIIGKK